MQTSTLSTKPHYPILDGLRGVAAIMVVSFHIFETHSTSHFDQIINHGYLAVDFFFLLSGFVIGYAYDDRWSRMSVGDFFKIRLVRLQPLVILGMMIGALLFYFGDSTIFPNIHNVPVWKVLIFMVIGFTVIPVTPSIEIRGWQEMHPLDGTAWSLFFEYIANILYALFVRKFSKTLLSIFVFLAGCFLLHLTLTSPKGDVTGGWVLDAEHLHIGLARLLYPFFAGLLLFRVSKMIRVKRAFLWCSLLVVFFLVMPRVGGSEHLWMNGLYESLTIIFIFPLIVYLGASGEVKGIWASKICKFFGDISYPLYITHYPIIYIYTGWVSNRKIPISEAFPVSTLVLISSVTLAYLSLKFFDEPIRIWLKSRFLMNNKLKPVPVPVKVKE